MEVFPFISHLCPGSFSIFYYDWNLSYRLSSTNFSAGLHFNFYIHAGRQVQTH